MRIITGGLGGTGTPLVTRGYASAAVVPPESHGSPLWPLIVVSRRRRGPAPQVNGFGSPLWPLIVIARRRGHFVIPTAPEPHGSPLWPLIVLARRSSASAVISGMPATLFEALRVRVKSLGGTAGLTDVYKNRPQRGFTYPFMVISSINGTDELNTSDSWMRTAEYQFSVMSPDDIQAETIGLAAYVALLPNAPAKNPKLVFADGKEIVRWPLYMGRLMEQSSRGTANANVWKYDFGYSIMTGRAHLP